MIYDHQVAHNNGSLQVFPVFRVCNGMSNELRGWYLISMGDVARIEK